MSRLFVNRLTVIDFSYLHRERGLLGHSLIADVELDGDLDAQGMVLDFGLVKKRIKQALDADFDHRLIVPSGHDGLEVDDLPDGRQRLRFALDDGSVLEHIAPADAVTLIDAPAITPAALVSAMQARLKPTMPTNVRDLVIHLSEEPIDGPEYQYSHGLKLHDGNCQRIAHGHRSRLFVWRNDKIDMGLAARWAARWRDIYVGTREDLVDTFKADGHEYHRFRYSAAQGEFELTLPASRCYLIDNESTVENLGQHIAEQLARQFPGERIVVQAFEGVDKGAFGQALYGGAVD